MATFDQTRRRLMGSGGSLAVRDDDEITLKLCMLIEGECEGLGPAEAARKFGYSRQRCFQLRAAFDKAGAAGLQSRKRGPKTRHRRSAEVVRQVVRHRFFRTTLSHGPARRGRPLSVRAAAGRRP